MDIKAKILYGFATTLRSHKISVYYILYYTLIESILVLSIPLTSSFVINSLVAHSYMSLFTLGAIILVVFLFIVFLRVLQEYIIEKFEQRVFVTQGYDVVHKTLALIEEKRSTPYPIDKLMNYFFDITTIQKIFPILILNGAGLMVQIIVTLILLLVFDISLFIGAAATIIGAVFLIIYFGKDGIKFAVERSNTKHDAIYFMQKLPTLSQNREELLNGFEHKMSEYVDARKRQYGIRIKQLSLSFMLQGVIITGFFITGGHLVINGSMPVGEFVAAEIIIVTLIYAINGFAKQLDYIYDGIEGFYKMNQLSSSLENHEKKEHTYE
jgi:ABC-type bacteriocin/lantibiotic exporter with double-glycine peptidase domain